jgi:hypothetical protein
MLIHDTGHFVLFVIFKLQTCLFHMINKLNSYMTNSLARGSETLIISATYTKGRHLTRTWATLIQLRAYIRMKYFTSDLF